jgi:dTDP-4-amino-4,6-dideoxygalactose transaminase
VNGILETGVYTNGPFVREFERTAAEYLGVANAIAVGSCTVGLLLVLRAAALDGEVIVPSFTFAATAHAVAWNGLRPVFADIDERSLTLDPDDVRGAVNDRTSAVLATHVYGTPCDTDGLEAVASERGLRLFFDAAHAFGSRRAGVPVGRSGDAEVFSLSPTKVLFAGEGGVVATDDDDLAERVRMGRNYGHPGDYDCRFPGLNGRMSELHAAVALASLEDLDDRVGRRNELADRYRRELQTVPGVSFPESRPEDVSTVKDFTLLIDPEGSGTDAGRVASVLAAAGIETKRYYEPPVHRMGAYADVGGARDLPITERASARALTVPLWDHMAPGDVDRVAETVRSAVS